MSLREIKRIRLEDLCTSWNTSLVGEEYTNQVKELQKKLDSESRVAKTGIEVPDSKTLIAVFAAIHLLRRQGGVTVYVPDTDKEKTGFIRFERKI